MSFPLNERNINTHTKTYAGIVRNQERSAINISRLPYAYAGQNYTSQNGIYRNSRPIQQDNHFLENGRKTGVRQQ